MQLLKNCKQKFYCWETDKMKVIKIVFGQYHKQLENEINKVIKQNSDKDVTVSSAYVDPQGMHYAVLEINDK